MLSLRFAGLALLALAALASADERGAIRAFEKAKRTEPELIAFLANMPKGGDLHNHASGAAYVDYMLDAAVKKGLFYDPETMRFGADATKIPAARLLTDDTLRYNFFNAASMRGWEGDGPSGHDHFFRTFGLFGSALDAESESEVLAEIVGRAKAQRLQYMELMFGPVPPAANAEYYASIPKSDDMPAALEVLRPKLEKILPQVKTYLDERDAMAKAIGQKSYTGTDEPITVRWIHSVNRLMPNDNFFAAAALGMFLSTHEPRVASMNILAPEDAPMARLNFPRQMEMLDFLWRNLGHPNLTLHAGELTPLISPPEPMRDRIRRTVEGGHARRIGHGVSIAHEDDVQGLLAEMKREGIAVEICLTSNASILGVSGDRHPLRLYRAAGVPVFLNTDDEGVSRSTMTMEWVRAVREQGMTYKDLKEMARNSLEYSFLSGPSLFKNHDYHHRQFDLTSRTLEMDTASGHEIRLRKIKVQYRLEQAFAEFERRFPS